MTKRGEHIGSGSFRVDRARAIEKLSAYQLEDPHQAALALLRCAVASGASGVRIVLSGGFSIGFDGRPLGPAELEDPFAVLFNEEASGDPRSRHLAVGLLGALRVARRVVVTGGPPDVRRWVELKSAAEFSTQEAPSQSDGPTQIDVEDALIDVKRLREDCWACPMPIWIDGKDLPRVRKPESPPGVYFEEEGRYGWVCVPSDPYRGTHLRLCALGARVGESDVPSGEIPVEGYVNDGGFVLNASQNGVVRNERFEAMARSVGAAAKRLVGETVEHACRSVPVTGRLIESALFAGVWRQANLAPRRQPLLEQRWFGRAYLSVQRLLGGDPERLEASLRSVRWDADCCRWFRHLAKTGALPGELRRAPLFLSTRGDAVSLDNIERRLERDGRVTAWKALPLSKAPDAIWCSTPAELADLQAMAPKGLEIV